MKQLMYELKQLCKDNRDGSYATQYKRDRDLQLIARQLTYDLGFPRMSIHSLKPKHIEALIEHWKFQEVAVGTIKCRMAHLRWWARKVNKNNVIAKDNNSYGIGNREYFSKISKSCEIDENCLNQIDDKFVIASVKLAKEFGLRKEEAIKFIPKYADQGDYIRLKASWCKGGKARTIPILNNQQRHVVDEAKSIAGSGSLIPANLKYYQQRTRYEKLTRKVGFKKLHGLRHRYAQVRYQELTGWNCPHLGGPSRRELKGHKREIDKQARLIISKELGHERIQIVANYIG